MKIAIVSDAHLLYQAEWLDNERVPREEETEVLDDFDRALADVAARAPTAVILAGDIFDSKAESGQRVVHREAEKYMQRIRRSLLDLADKAGCKIYVLRGNHDSEPVLRGLEGTMQGKLEYVGREPIRIGDLNVALMDTHYLTGSYEIPLEDVPEKADVLVMHESIPIPMVAAPPLATFREICKHFGKVFNGHMHFYGEKVLGIPNLTQLPAFIPSRRIKSNWMVKYHCEEGKIDIKTQPSPFGFLLFDETDSEFVRYTPNHIIVRVELRAKSVSEFASGVQQVYGVMMEQENHAKFRVWVATNADKITIDRVLRERVEQYPEIKTVDFIPEKWDGQRAATPVVQNQFGDAAFTRDELIERLLPDLKGRPLEIARGLFDEVFTPQVLASKSPSDAEGFRKLLEVVSRGEAVSDSFVQRAYDLQKERFRA